MDEYGETWTIRGVALGWLLARAAEHRRSGREPAEAIALAFRDLHGTVPHELLFALDERPELVRFGDGLHLEVRRDGEGVVVNAHPALGPSSAFGPGSPGEPP